MPPNTRPPAERACARCGTVFRPRSDRHRFCSRACGQRAPRRRGPRPASWRVDRPPYEQLLAEIAELGYVGVGRRYGFSDNAVRKWRLAYEREREDGSALGSPASGSPGPDPAPGVASERSSDPERL